VVAIKVVDKVEAVPATEEEPEKPEVPAYMLTHVSFQSTSSTNISGVNNLNQCRLNVRKKERGKGENKREYGVENNEARELYLGIYHGVDAFDHMIKICGLFYISWKYWHSPMLHAFSMAIVTAYSFYLECASGSLDPEWKVEKEMTFYEFRVQLARQMLAYDPKDMNYPGEDKLRCNTQTSKKKRKRAKKRKRQDQVTKVQFREAKRGGKKARLCGDLDNWEHHVAHFQSTCSRVCAYCGKGGASIKCTLCDVFLHNQTARANDATCSIDWHNDHHFGLAKSDAIPLLHKKKGDYNPPTTAEKQANKRIIKSFTAKRT